MEGFILEKRIYYHDTDCGGVVYYANYLKYLEEARTEYLISKGMKLKDLADRGIIFVVAKVDIEYKAPAHYQDTIQIVTTVERAKISAVQFLQKVFRGGTLLTEAKTTLICVGSDLKPLSIPDEIKAVLTL